MFLLPGSVLQGDPEAYGLKSDPESRDSVESCANCYRSGWASTPCQTQRGGCSDARKPVCWRTIQLVPAASRHAQRQAGVVKSANSGYVCKENAGYDGDGDLTISIHELNRLFDRGVAVVLYSERHRDSKLQGGRHGTRNHSGTACCVAEN